MINMNPFTFEVGQVWKKSETNKIVIVTQLNGDMAVVAPDHQLEIEYARSHYVHVGHLADNYLLRARPITAVNPSEALRKQAADMRAKASRMIEDANTLDRAAKLLEDKAYEDGDE